MHNINHSERLPYEKLAALGIDREKADSLPQEVKEKLASGEVTPLFRCPWVPGTENLSHFLSNYS